MKATTKYKLHNRLILPLALALWMVCAFPMLVGAPFEWLLTKFYEWADRRASRLRKKYNVGYYATPDNKTILKEIEDGNS